MFVRGMRQNVLAGGAGFLLLAGCGYVGPVLPPSPELPQQVADLAVIERGDQILITFTAPLRTTDNLVIKRFSEIDLRIGPAATPFDFDRWATTAKSYPPELPEPNDPVDPQPISLSQTIPAATWQGQHIAVAVRTAVKKRDHYSAWSNRVVLDVVASLVPPVASVSAVPQGVRIEWQPSGANLRYRVSRQGPADKEPLELGIVDQTSFIDSTAQYDTSYRYSVVALHGAAQSLPSPMIEITPVDKFPPSIPAALTALSGPASVELSWQRSSDSDIQGYYVYRAQDAGPFERQGGLISLPTYSDRRVEHGKTYHYQVSAMDKKNNESAKSPPVDIHF